MIHRSHNRTVDSSFLTEEEDAIKKISEKIKFIKAKISSKEPKTSRRGKKSDGHSSSDDTDTKELQHLNEQIRQIKSKMILKGDQLNKMKKNSNDEFIQKSRQKKCSGPIYLPINHISRRHSQNTYQIRPANFCSQSYDDDEQDGEVMRGDMRSSITSSKYYVVNKSGGENNGFSASPERKYMSSVEIPAEQLEAFKGTSQ